MSGCLVVVRVPDMVVLRRVTDVSVFLGYVPPGSRRYVTFDGVTVVVDMRELVVSFSGSPACVGGWRLRLGGGVYAGAV